MSILIDACATQDTIVVTTRSSVYELVVLRGDRGEVRVRGGRHFEEARARRIARFSGGDDLCQTTCDRRRSPHGLRCS